MKSLRPPKPPPPNLFCTSALLGIVSPGKGWWGGWEAHNTSPSLWLTYFIGAFPVFVTIIWIYCIHKGRKLLNFFLIMKALPMFSSITFLLNCSSITFLILFRLKQISFTKSQYIYIYHIETNFVAVN